MKIVLCIPTLGRGGAERQLSYLAEGLQARGHEVHVLFSRDGEYSARLKSCGVQLHPVTGRSNYDLRVFWRMLRFVQRLRPHIVQTCILQMDVLGGMCSILTRTPWILREATTRRLKPINAKEWVRFTLASRVSAVVTNSAYSAERWRLRSKGIPVLIIRNALPLNEIERAMVNSSAESPFPSMGVAVLFAGRFAPEKNVLALVRAFMMISSQVPVTLVLCGDGPLKTDVDKLIEREGASDRIRSLGHSNDIWGIMKHADVFVSVSTVEGMPNAVLEASACRCRLVVSDIPPHREILDERCAAFVDPYDVSDIARGIVEEVNAVLSASLENSDRAFIRGNVSISEMTSQYEALYRRMIGARTA